MLGGRQAAVLAEAELVRLQAVSAPPPKRIQIQASARLLAMAAGHQRLFPPECVQSEHVLLADAWMRRLHHSHQKHRGISDQNGSPCDS